VGSHLDPLHHMDTFHHQLHMLQLMESREEQRGGCHTEEPGVFPEDHQEDVEPHQ